MANNNTGTICWPGRIRKYGLSGRRGKNSQGLGMKKRSVIFLLPLIAGLLTGCDNKMEIMQFEKARQAALNADDPFQALDAFNRQAGEYGLNCDTFGNLLFGTSEKRLAACNTRDRAIREIVLRAIEKGSVPALVFLFEPHKKSPEVYPENLGSDEATKLAEKLVEMAEKSPADSKDTALLMRAGVVLQSGYYVHQDPRRAADLYVRAWLAGNKYAANKLAELYRFLKDFRRAYFWEIRSRNLKNDSRSYLSGQEISDIQRLVADDSRGNI